jgi:TolB protein
MKNKQIIGLKTEFFIGMFTLLAFSSLQAEQIHSSVSLTNDQSQIVAVGEAKTQTMKLSILPPSSKKGVELSEPKMKLVNGFYKILQNDFSFYRKLFQVPDYSLENPQAWGSVKSMRDSGWPDYDFWNQKETIYLVSSMFEKSDEGVTIELKVYDIKNKSELLHLSFPLKTEKLREKSHEIADNIYQKLTGQKSIFLSQLAFVCDLGTTHQKKTVKELFLSDFDGYQGRQLTHHKSIVISPSFSADKKQILYSLLNGEGRKRNIDLFSYQTDTQQSSPVSVKKGLNTGAVFHPDGEQVALTLTYTGQADIYLLNPKTQQLRPLTRHPSDDVDPSFTPDGKQMVFLSGRAGKAMIYMMDTEGTEKNVKRLSFVGQFNASPRVSPDGQFVTFSSWVDRSFDIFLLNLNNMAVHRLTKDFGQCEDPGFSPDGQFIVFSSTHHLRGKVLEKNVYIMDKDGEILGSVTHQLGNCTSPRWSNY